MGFYLLGMVLLGFRTFGKRMFIWDWDDYNVCLFLNAFILGWGMGEGGKPAVL